MNSTLQTILFEWAIYATCKQYFSNGQSTLLANNTFRMGNLSYFEYVKRKKKSNFYYTRLSTD